MVYSCFKASFVNLTQPIKNLFAAIKPILTKNKILPFHLIFTRANPIKLLHKNCKFDAHSCNYALVHDFVA